jgi:predicted dehydrogenase
MVQANRTSSYLHSGVLRRGSAKLREPLNFPDWQATAASKMPDSPDRFLNWRFYSMYGGGPVCDLGVHILDGIHVMASAGLPATVTARGVRSKEEGFNTAERATILVEYPNGLLVSLVIDGGAVAPHELSIIDGASGRIEIDTHQARGSTYNLRSLSAVPQGLFSRSYTQPVNSLHDSPQNLCLYIL